MHAICPLSKLRTEFTSPVAISTLPGLLETTSFARCIKKIIMHNLVIYIPCTSRCFKLIHKPLYPQIDHLSKTDPKFRDAIEVCLQLSACVILYRLFDYLYFCKFLLMCCMVIAVFLNNYPSILLMMAA